MTLPVYIFSLHGLAPELLLENYEQVSALVVNSFNIVLNGTDIIILFYFSEHDSVIILTTDKQSVSSPFIIDSDKYYIDATEIDRHIIAGM